LESFPLRTGVVVKNLKVWDVVLGVRDACVKRRVVIWRVVCIVNESQWIRMWMDYLYTATVQCRMQSNVIRRHWEGESSKLSSSRRHDQRNLASALYQNQVRK